MSEAIEIDDRLQAYFDDELEETERAAIAARLAADPEMGRRLEDLHFMRTIVAGSLDKQAERVHEARFEQIWDEIDRTLERDARLQQAVDQPPSLLTRMLGLLRSARMPLATVAVAAGVAAVVVMTVGKDDDDRQNNGVVAASDPDEGTASPSPPAREGEPAAADAPTADRLASAEPPTKAPEQMEEIFSQPESNDAEIDSIEFGGQSGSIAHIEGARGTTTVIWVVEDEEPVDSERSL